MVTAKVLQGIDRLMEVIPVDVVVGQGDTASVLAASLASFFRRIPFAHVEAGLRTGNFELPFPEEMNRVITSRLTRWHFAPTKEAQLNLLAEGVSPNTVWVTGNTVIDALKHVLTSIPEPVLPVKPGREFVLITTHRRENQGAPMVEICKAIRDLAFQRPELDFVLPVHPSPAVKEVVFEQLQGLTNVLLIEPCDYPEFCWLMKKAKLILSDSGGVQEEAPALGVPVLVLRNETERPEAAALGASRLVGTARETIVTMASLLLDDANEYALMATAGSPYGDGTAAHMVVDTMRAALA
jgi:UDP-N-acetylglucosamine 2-epimerase (non-hydrolysing)